MIEQADQMQANGTSYHGHTIKAKLSKLKELFGEPFYGDDDKVQYDWVLQTHEGIIFTIYDWKKRRFAEDQKIEWHIGGFNALGTHKAKNLVEFEIINLFAEEFLNNTK
jgi:hypothetical protein